MAVRNRADRESGRGGMDEVGGGVRLLDEATIRRRERREEATDWCGEKEWK